MQAIFDPSQGFFNAIIFVFLSSKDRANLGIFLTTPYLFLQFISWLRSLCGYSDVSNDSSGELQYPGRDNRDRLVGGTVTSPLARPSRFAVQEDTIVELSSHFHTESEMTNYFDRSESEESSRVPTISRITRDSFSVPTFNDEC